MFYYQYPPVIADWYRNPQMQSYIRIFNASPNAPGIDIYANNTPIAQNLSYNQFSQYIPIYPGNYNIKIYPAGEKTNLLLDTNVYIPQNTIFNLAVIGKYPDISIYTIPEPYTKQTFERACIRFINLVPNSPTLDVTFSDGTNVFNNVGYKDITNYACIPSGTYNFNVNTTSDNKKIAAIPNTSLAPNNYYTIYALGLYNRSIPLKFIVVQEPR